MMNMPVFPFSMVFARFPDNPDQLVTVPWKIQRYELWVQVEGSWKKVKTNDTEFFVIHKGKRILLDFLRTDVRY